MGSFVTLYPVRAETPERIRSARTRHHCQPGEGNQQEILAGLTSDRFERALAYAYAYAYAYAVPDGITAERLTELPPYVLVSAEHPLAGRGGITPHEIRDDPFILLDLPISRDNFLNLFPHLRHRVPHRLPFAFARTDPV